ncbi:MAG: hypothetical protein F6K42_17170 [Leptolyngbya sp. SIO1D8]|nr:hypothetical protein [Leptolyngbya sp. SIO1D8]
MKFSIGTFPLPDRTYFTKDLDPCGPYEFRVATYDSRRFMKQHSNVPVGVTIERTPHGIFPR